MTEEQDELKYQKLWGWVADEGRPLLKSEAATKICPVMASALEPMLCQTTDCMAFQELAIGGKMHCRCGMLPHGKGVL